MFMCHLGIDIKDVFKVYEIFHEGENKMAITEIEIET